MEGLARSGGLGEMRQNDQSSMMKWLGYVVVVTMAAIVVSSFIQPYNLYIVEPDVHIEWTENYRSVIAARDLSKFATILHGVPHLDGPFVIYALLSYVVDLTAGVLSYPFASESERDVFTLKYTNAAMFALTSGFLYLGALRLSRSWWCSALAALAFLGCPQIYMMDLTRIDHVANFLLIVVLYLSIRLLQEGPTRRLAVLLGIACGAHMASKLNGFFIFLIPTIALLLRRSPARVWMSFAGIAGAISVITTTVLLFRYVAQLPDMLAALQMQFDALAQWSTFVGTTPRIYYNLDIFALVPHVPEWQRTAMLWLWTFAGVLVITLLPITAAKTREIRWLFLPVLLLVFSVAGLFVMKYTRGGYHLVPIYILGLVACFAATSLSGILRPFALATSVLPFAVLAGLTVLQASPLYAEMKSREASYANVLTRVAAREWITDHIRPKARLCLVIHTEWTGPWLTGLDYQRVLSVFQIPYTNRAALSSYEPPSIEEVRQQCDFVLLNDCTKALTRDMFGNWGLTELGDRWRAFWAHLEASVKPVVFEAPIAAYCTKRMEVLVLNTAVRNAAGREGLSSPR